MSRSIVHWDIREAMTETDIEIIIQRGRKKYPQAKPRIISDNGPQFIAKDFKEFVRVFGEARRSDERALDKILRHPLKTHRLIDLLCLKKPSARRAKKVWVTIMSLAKKKRRYSISR